MYQKILDPINREVMSNCIKRVSDGAIIPADPLNMDYQAFLKWCAEGNAPLEADPLPQPEPQPE